MTSSGHNLERRPNVHSPLGLAPFSACVSNYKKDSLGEKKTEKRKVKE